MKKFIGNVNGKSFDNEEDFNKAADEAIKKNDGNLAISSYYTYTSDDEDKKEVLPADDKYVSTNEYFLGDRIPDKVEKLESDQVGEPGYTNLEYSASPELEERLKVASNKSGIKESIEYHVTKLTNNIKHYREYLRALEKKIEELQNELYEQQEALVDQEARRKYYNHLLDVIENSEIKKVEEPTPEFKVDKTYTTPEAKEKIKEFLDIDENTSLFTVLKKLGILK